MSTLIDMLDRLQIAIDRRSNTEVFQIIDELEIFCKTAFIPKETQLERSDEEQIIDTIIEMGVVNPELSQIQSMLRLDLQDPYLSKLAIALELLKLRMEEKGTSHYSNNHVKAIRFLISTFRYEYKPHHIPDDLSFLSNPDDSILVPHSQTVLGKPPKAGSFVFPEKYIWMMFPDYWKEDRRDIPYFTPSQKKLMKATRQEDGQLNRPMDGGNKLEDGSYLYVISPKGGLYLCQNKEDEILIDQGVFTSGLHHSSFRAGQPVLCAGEIEIKHGEITTINTNSGHYAVPEANLLIACIHLSRKGILKARCTIETAEKKITVMDLLDDNKYESLRREYIQFSAEITEEPIHSPTRK